MSYIMAVVKSNNNPELVDLYIKETIDSDKEDIGCDYHLNTPLDPVEVIRALVAQVGEYSDNELVINDKTGDCFSLEDIKTAFGLDN